MDQDGIMCTWIKTEKIVPGLRRINLYSGSARSNLYLDQDGVICTWIKTELRVPGSERSKEYL